MIQISYLACYVTNLYKKAGRFGRWHMAEIGPSFRRPAGDSTGTYSGTPGLRTRPGSSSRPRRQHEIIRMQDGQMGKGNENGAGEIKKGQAFDGKRKFFRLDDQISEYDQGVKDDPVYENAVDIPDLEIVQDNITDIIAGNFVRVQAGVMADHHGGGK